MLREIIIFGNYFPEFIGRLDSKTKEKVTYVLDMIRSIDRVPDKFLKHMEGTDGLYEIRIKSGSNIYRVFCCFDKGRLVILLNGFQKKDQKTPKNEIALALKLKIEYFKMTGHGNKITKYEDLLDKEYGKLGTEEREAYELRSLSFRVGEMVKQERLKNHLTQKQLAERSGTKRTYISRIENGRSDIQLNTLHKIIESGLGKKMNLTIN